LRTDFESIYYTFYGQNISVKYKNLLTEYNSRLTAETERAESTHFNYLNNIFNLNIYKIKDFI